MGVTGVVLAGLWLQGDLNSTAGSRWLLVFVGLVAVGMVVQAIVVAGMAVGAAKTRKRVMEMAEELRSKVIPLIDRSHELVHEIAPKVKVITDNLEHTSHLVRTKADEFQVTATVANAKTRAQVERVDGMVTSVLDATTDAATMLSNAVRVPARELSGLVNGLKAGIDVLLGRRNGSRPEAVDEPVSRI